MTAPDTNTQPTDEIPGMAPSPRTRGEGRGEGQEGAGQPHSPQPSPALREREQDNDPASRLLNANRYEAPAGAVRFDATDRQLIDRLHGDLPLTERPFADVGRELGLSEDEVLERLRQMLAHGTLTRFGPLFQIERAGGQFVLAAIDVPAADFERIAALVNSLPEVAHNYRREHRLNMWFVVAAESQAAADAALARIAQITGLHVFAFPKEREYFVGLRLSALEAGEAGGTIEHGHEAKAHHGTD
jgi:siroheme decarboxylase